MIGETSRVTDSQSIVGWEIHLDTFTFEHAPNDPYWKYTVTFSGEFRHKSTASYEYRDLAIQAAEADIKALMRTDYALEARRRQYQADIQLPRVVKCGV